MWTWRGLLCVSLAAGLALDSNTIRSSKETQQSAELPDRSHGDQVERPVRRRAETSSNSNRGQTECPAEDCSVATSGGCSNRAQRRASSRDRQEDRQEDRETDTQLFNRTKAPEMAGCVRSGDCAPGLCCVRYLTGRRCQRIPAEGEACLLRGSKQRRRLGRCDCQAGLSCAAVSRADAGGKVKGQGVCRPRQAARTTRHSGKKRRTAERSC